MGFHGERRGSYREIKILVEREIYAVVYMQGATKPPDWTTLRVERKAYCRSKLPELSLRTREQQMGGRA